MAPQRTILIAEGDEVLRRALKEQIVAAELFDAVEEADRGAAVLARAGSQAFDVILLDLDLPDQDGRDVCRALRAAGARAPIITLTAADSDDDAVTGLQAGATDTISKPFRMAMLLARLQAHLRHQAQADASLMIGPYSFQPAAKLLTHIADARKIRLTEKETAILRYLHQVGPKTVPREMLLGEVWGYNANITTHTLETHIYRLRQKIEPDPQQVQLLVTEPGGYRLNP